jgi:cold shock CspA family protein
MKMHGDRHEARSVPVAALSTRVGEFQLANDDEGAKTAPIRLVARAGKPIEHWYFGRVVHDFAGMRHKGRIPIDYGHDDKEIIGYANRFDTSSGDLNLAGALVPFNERDRAAEVAYKSRNGVPYEASIDFRDQMAMEELRAGQFAEVNGQRVDGPATIIREWTLRGVAVCPYGADPNTSSQLSNAEQFTVSVTKGASMNTDNSADTKAAKPSGKGFASKIRFAGVTKETCSVVEHDDDAPAQKPDGAGFANRIRFARGEYKPWLDNGSGESSDGAKAFKPEQHTSRHALFSVSAATAMAEAAENLGIKLADLNDEQRGLLVTMADRPLSRRQRLRMLADAADRAMHEGTIDRLRLEKGFGFIRAAGLDDVFFNVGDVTDMEWDETLLERRVRFYIVTTERGLKAKQVCPAD